MKKRQGLLTRFVKAIAVSVREAFEQSVHGGLSASGAVVNPETAMRISTVNACVRIISQTVGSIPLHIYKRRDNGGRDRWTAHPLYKLLNAKPNVWQTSMEWREQMMSHLLLRGNYYAAILRHGDNIIDDLIPLDPDSVEVKQLPDYTLEYTIRRSGKTAIVLKQSDVLHVRGLSTDGILGRSVIADARDLFGSALSVSDYGSRLFRNDATPGLIITHPKKLSDEAYKRLRESWDSRHSGTENAGRTAILEEGAGVEKVAMSADEAQFLETNQVKRSEIAGWFGVPLSLLSFNENTQTYASAEQFMLSFVMHTIRPWIVRLEQSIHAQLFSAPDLYYPEFTMEALLRGDLASRNEAYSIAISWGWMCPNEVRERENMNARDGGDVFLEPQNYRPAGSYDKTGGK